MNRTSISGMVVLLAGLGALLGPGPGDAAAQEGRKERVRRLVEKLGYPEWLREIVRRQLSEGGKADPAKVEEGLKTVKWDPLLDWVVSEIEKRVDDATLDEVLPYLDTAEGKRHLALVRLERSRIEVDFALALGPTQGRSMGEMMEGFTMVVSEATGRPRVKGPLGAARESSNEATAIATLRNLATCQARLQATGKIDCDNDGIGEYGTFLELTGSVAVRKSYLTGEEGPPGSDFSVRGTVMHPSPMGPTMSNVDATGIGTRSGYCFRLFLPDTSRVSGFVHEVGPAAEAWLTGGSGRVCVDLAETTWCAYAWPAVRGTSGTRAFFVNQNGDVMQSANEVAQWSGPAKGPPGHAALLGQGITAQMAVGTRGQDGDVWKVVN